MNTLTKTLAFNTGRQYSEAGQRIAAIELPSGHIAMLDLDRGLDYVIPAGAADLTQASIMGAYDRGDLENIWSLNIDLDQYAQILADLNAAAAGLK